MLGGAEREGGAASGLIYVRSGRRRQTAPLLLLPIPDTTKTTATSPRRIAASRGGVSRECRNLDIVGHFFLLRPILVEDSVAAALEFDVKHGQSPALMPHATKGSSGNSQKQLTKPIHVHTVHFVSEYTSTLQASHLTSWHHLFMSCAAAPRVSGEQSAFSFHRLSPR